MHDIGKNIVKLLLSTSGFDIVDLGKDVKVAVIIDRAEEVRARVIGVSALMTTTMGYMPDLIQELEELGIKTEFPVMVGGAPVTEEWAKEIGADGYAKDAVGAIRVAKGLAEK
jgi:5-methyltetrahydrofolate--homocysteine methyltransferase